MNEFFDDPRFDRPQHQDFWKLAKAVNKVDAYADEDKMGLEEILSEKVNVDPESLIYMARQRALRTRTLVSTTMLALYVDAFSAGVMYERGD